MHKLYYKEDSGIWLRNVSFSDLVEQLLARARDQRLSEDESIDVNKLAEMYEAGELWSGRCFDMSEDLMELALPRFWSEQLCGLSEDILTGGIGPDFENSRKLSLIYGSYAWSVFFGLRAREEERLN